MLEVDNPEESTLNPFSSNFTQEASQTIENSDFHKYTPIKALTTNLGANDWKIKARITKKYDLRTWKNARGTGTLLNIDLIDGYGSQIYATFFNDAANRFN